jgi:putative FmdB family regulatory protein
MPLYEYRCPTCGEKQELLARSAASAAAPSCSVCGVSMEKLWAPVAFGKTSGGGGSGAGCAHGGGGFS